MEEPRHTQVDPEESTVDHTVEDCETVPASDLALTEAGRQIDALGPGVQVGVWSPSPTPVAELRAGAVPVASRRLVLVSDARAMMDMVHETQHDSDSEDEFPIANDSSQSQQVVVALADPGASRHVMGDAVVANSGRFHVLSSGVDEEHLIPATSSTRACEFRSSPQCCAKSPHPVCGVTIVNREGFICC